MSCFSLLVVILLLFTFGVGQLLQGSDCIEAIRASDEDSNGFLTIVEFSLLAAFSDNDCLTPSITDTTRFNTLSDGTASINVQVVYQNPPGFIETSLMSVVCVNAFSSPYTCQADTPVVTPTVPATAAPVNPAPVVVSPPQPQPQAPQPTAPETFPGCSDALEFADRDNSDTLDFDEFLILVDVVLDCSTLVGAPVRTFFENALCLCPSGTAQCCTINSEINIRNNRDRICIEAYSLRLFATVNPNGCASPTQPPTRSPTIRPTRSPVSKEPTRVPLPTNQPIAPTTRQPIIGTAVPTATIPTENPTTLSPTLTFVSNECLDRLDDADNDNDGFIDIEEFPVLATGRVCELVNWNVQAFQIFQDLANCSPNCPIVTSTTIPLQDRTQLERICEVSRNAVVCITDPPTQSPTTLQPTQRPTIIPPTATTPCEQTMRDADDNEDQRLDLTEFSDFLFQLADCRTLPNSFIVQSIFTTSSCECRRLRDPACCSSASFVDISVLFQPRNDTTRDYITAVCTASQAINAFVGPGDGGCTEAPTVLSTQSPVTLGVMPTVAPVGVVPVTPPTGGIPTTPPSGATPTTTPTVGDAPTVIQQTLSPAQPVMIPPSFAPVNGPPLSRCESSLRLGNADDDETMTRDEYALFLFYLGSCATILTRTFAFEQAFRTSISSCAVLGLPGTPCFLNAEVINIASLYIDIDRRSSSESGQINTICSIGLGALAGGQVVDSANPVGCTESPTKSPSESPITLSPTISPTITITISPTPELPDSNLESCVALIGSANTIPDNFLNEAELLLLANTLSACPVQENSIFLQFLFASFSCNCGTDLLCCSDGIAKIDVTGFLVPFSLRTIPQRRQLESFCASLLSITDPADAICPTQTPTTAPTSTPIIVPTSGPTRAVTSMPTISPTTGPTIAPTVGPTRSPTKSPTESPSKLPIDPPTQFPAKSPTISPQTFAPIRDGQPTRFPVESPTDLPVQPPTVRSTSRPVPSPSNAPVNTPFQAPLPISSPIGSPAPDVPIPSTPSPQPAPPIAPPVAPVLPVSLPVSNPVPNPTVIPVPAPVLAPVPAPLPTATLPVSIPTPPIPVPLPAPPIPSPLLAPVPLLTAPIPVPLLPPVPVVDFSFQNCVDAILSADEDVDMLLDQDEYRAFIAALSGCDLTSSLSDVQLGMFQELACLCEFEPDGLFPDCCLRVSQQRVSVGGVTSLLEELSVLQRLVNVCDQTRSVIPPGCAPSPTNAPTTQPFQGMVPTRIPPPTPMAVPTTIRPPSSQGSPATTKPIATPSTPNVAQPINPPPGPPASNPNPTRTSAPIALIRETGGCRAFFDEQINTANGRLTQSRFFDFVEQLSGCRYNDNDLPIPLRAVLDELGSAAGNQVTINLSGGVDSPDDLRFVDRRAQVCYEVAQAIGGTTCVDGPPTETILTIPEAELQGCTKAMIQADNGDEKLDRFEFQSFLSFYGGCIVDDLDFGNYVSFYSFACTCEEQDFVCCFPIATVNVSGVALSSEQRSDDQITRISQVCAVANGLLTANQTSCEPLPERPDPSIGDKECSDQLILADENSDERLNRDEFRRFLQLRFPDECGDITTIPHYQSIIFNLLSCACLFEQLGNPFCCLPHVASIQLSGVELSVAMRDKYQRGTIATVCEATRVAAEFGCTGPKEVVASSSTPTLETATSDESTSGATDRSFPILLGLLIALATLSLL